MPFSLRNEGDSENPSLATVYGKQITAGKLTYFLKEGRMKCILILGEGEMDGVDKVYYNGEILPEYSSAENTDRNWHFHPGTITTQPAAYYDVTTITTDTLTLSSNPFIVGSEVAFAAGVDPEVSPYPAGVKQHQKFYVVSSVGNTIKVSSTLGGTAITGWTSGQYLLDNLKVYAATAGFFDPIQGRPEFFPVIDFTLSGIAYLEVNLPADQSELEEEPTKFKIYVRGRRLQNYTDTGLLADAAGVAYNPAALPPQTKHFSANNALVALDIILNYMKVVKTRIDWPSFVAFRNHCDEQIAWNSGTIKILANPTTTMTSTITSPAQGTYTKSSGASAWDAGVLTSVFANPGSDVTVSAVYRAGSVAIGLTSSTTIPVGYADGLFSVRPDPTDGKTRVYQNGSTTAIHVNDIPYQIGDTYKIEVVNSTANFYKNDTLFFTTPTGWGAVTARGYTTLFDVSSSVSDFKFYPVTGGTRTTNRFDAHVVFPQEVDSSSALQQVLGRSPSVHWQDVNGKIKFVVGTGFADITWNQTPTAGQRVLSEIFSYDINSSSYLKAVDPTLATEENYALTGIASASSTSSTAYPVSSINNGISVTGTSWGAGEGWNSASGPTVAAPEWAVVDWEEPRPINEINVYTLADAIQYTSLTAGQTFTLYGLVDFKIQYWNGASWTTIKDVVGNTLVKYSASFPILTTDKIRIYVTKSTSGAARIVEVEAVGPSVIHSTVPYSNIVADSFSAYKTPPENKPNFLRLELRDLDDPYYTKKYVYNDREALRDQTGVLVDFGIVPLGVATQSLADRLGEAVLRWGADLDLFINLKGFGSTYAVAKGDIVKVAHDITAWGLNNPGEFIVVEETIEPSTDTADEKSYLLQAYNSEYYSDNAHGAITANYPDAISAFTPPPAIESLILFEESRTQPNGPTYSVIVGRVNFDTSYPYTQRARVYWKRSLDLEFVATSLVLEQPNTGVTEISFEIPFAQTGINEIRVITETLTGVVSTSSVTETVDISGTLRVEEVNWEAFVNSNTLAGVLIKSVGTTAWDSAAQSSRAVAFGDAYMQFTTIPASNGFMAGFNAANKGNSGTAMKYAFRINYGALPTVWINGVENVTSNVVVAATGQSYKIDITTGFVKFYQIINEVSVLVYTTTNQNVYPLYVDTSIYVANSSVPAIQLYGNLEQNTGSKVHWSSVRGVNITYPGVEEVITKSGAQGWSGTESAGTYSLERITKNGAVEWVATETNTFRMIGLSEVDAELTSSTVEGYQGIKYGFYMQEGGVITARYFGLAYWANTYTTGDTLRVERVNGNINFRKNGVVVFSFTTDPFKSTQPLYVDTAFYNTGSTIKDVKLKRVGNYIGVIYPYSIYLVQDLYIKTNRPQEDGTTYFELAGVFNTTDEAPILRAHVRVLNKFGTEVVNYPPFTYAGNGLLGWGFHDRKYADPNEEAIYEVRLDNGVGLSAAIFSKAGIETFAPPALLNLALAVQDLTCSALDHNRVSLNWTFNGNVDIWMRIAGQAWVASPTVSNIGTKPHVFTNLVPNTYYEFRAAPNGTTVNFSNICRAKTLQAPLQTETSPPALSVVGTLNGAAPSTSVDLAWNRNSTTNTGVKVFKDGVQYGATLAATATTLTVTGLTASTAYLFKVVNVYAGGDSIESNIVSITTASGSTSTQTPSGLSALATSSNEIRLAWTNNVATGTINIHRSLNGTTFTFLANVAASISAYDNPGLSAQTTYWYKVENTGATGFSNTASDTTLSALGGGGYCILPNTLIWVYRSLSLQQIEARNVKVGDTVLTIRKRGKISYTKVKKVKKGTSDTINIITTESGKSLECTPSHPIVTNLDIDYVKATTLGRGKEVLTYNPQLARVDVEMVESKETLEGNFNVVIFELDGEDHTFVSNDIVSHNRKDDEL